MAADNTFDPLRQGNMPIITSPLGRGVRGGKQDMHKGPTLLIFYKLQFSNMYAWHYDIAHRSWLYLCI